MSFPRISSANPSLPRVGTHGQDWAPLEGAEVAVAVAVQGRGGSAVTSHLVELGLKVLLSPGVGSSQTGQFPIRSACPGCGGVLVREGP